MPIWAILALLESGPGLITQQACVLRRCWQILNSDLQGFLEVDVRVDGELSQCVTDEMVSAYVQHQEGVACQQGLQRQQHKHVVQVGTTHRHLARQAATQHRERGEVERETGHHIHVRKAGLTQSAHTNAFEIDTLTHFPILYDYDYMIIIRAVILTR